MRSSVISGLLYLTISLRSSQGFPHLSQLSLQQPPAQSSSTGSSLQQLPAQSLSTGLSLQQPVSQFSPTPSNVHARAILSSPSGAPIFGIVDFRFASGGGAHVEVIMHGLNQIIPNVGHPYHIHTNGVGPDGNCEAAGGHLSPSGVPDSVPCNPATPQLCQEGDLSGKWGLLSGVQQDSSVIFTDQQLQFTPGPTGIIGRAVVVHDGRGNRIACGNINLK